MTDDVPGTPAPLPFELLAAAAGFGALITGLVAMFAEPFAVYAYWFLCLDWLVLSLFAAVRSERTRGISLGSIGVLAPIVTSVILGANALTQFPG
jgi:hypothetical protein